jgi:hypothetical protein
MVSIGAVAAARMVSVGGGAWPIVSGLFPKKSCQAEGMTAQMMITGIVGAYDVMNGDGAGE